MSESAFQEPLPSDTTQVDLRQVADLLRTASHLDPQTQKLLASLLDELGTELNSNNTNSVKTARLTDAVHDVVRSLHEQHPTGLIENARNQLKEAALRAESEAPVATGVVYRLIEALSSVGI